MFIGVIKTKDVLLHPVTMVAMRGIKGFFLLLLRALSPKPYPFISNIENSQWADPAGKQVK